MRKLFFILALIVFSSCCFADTMRDVLKDGKSFGKERAKEVGDVIKNAKEEESENSKTFDPDKAREMLLEKQDPKSDVRDYLLSADVRSNLKKNRGFTDDEYFLERGNEIIVAAEKGMEEVESLSEYEEVKCREAVDLIPITIERNLKVTVKESLQKEVKVCKGHRIKKEWYKGHENNAKNEYEKFKQDLEKSPSTKSVAFDKPHNHSYKISVWYMITHSDDAACCDHFQVDVKQRENNQEVVDEWVYADESLLSLMQSPDCMLVTQNCTDANSTKIINGKEIHRTCWKESLSFLIHQKSNNDCAKLKSKKCDLIEKKCLKEGVNGCCLWDLTYKCYTKVFNVLKSKEEDSCLDENNWETAYEPNQSLADITTKLAVFEEIEKEMEKSQKSATNIQIFDAKKMKCSKSVASDLVFDCCFSHKGLATQVGLAKCSTDELALAEMREKGVSHYVGHYSETVLGIKTQDKHVFCCFESKLARIINEQGRQQLGMNWGSAEKPNCNGFSIDELGRLDFSKLDLTEVFEDYNKNISQNSQGKIKEFQDSQENITDFQERLKARMEQVSTEIQM